MSEFARKTDILKGFSPRGKVRDAVLGEGTLFENLQSGEKILCVSRTLNDKETLVREIERKKKRILDKNEYILPLHDYAVEVVSQLCATAYHLSLYYEHAPRTLYQEIVDRKSSIPPRPFSMEELTHLLYHQVIAHAFLQERGTAHGDICPQTIVITRDRKFKIAFRPTEASTERAQLDKMLKKTPLYIAPQLYQNLGQRAFDRKNYNAHKADVFSLGLSILQAGIMRQVDRIYAEGRVDNDHLQKYIEEFEKAYEDNPLLCTTVANFLRVDERERKDFVEIVNALPDYKEITEYFYKLEHGLLEEAAAEEDSVGLNDSLPNNYQFSHPQEQYNVDSGSVHHAQTLPPEIPEHVYHMAPPAYTPLPVAGQAGSYRVMLEGTVPGPAFARHPSYSHQEITHTAHYQSRDHDSSRMDSHSPAPQPVFRPVSLPTLEVNHPQQSVYQSYTAPYEGRVYVQSPATMALPPPVRKAPSKAEFADNFALVADPSTENFFNF